ncbi:hypothetical protein CAEBREN_09208 [Caenorhabditis brenneri]|uniref:Sdz-33 F-box domain-containing protein n=1 Tax=Caenorhabditis brenneri TaxID=135651 RepID=G0M9L1_CAEBE|nr:hypothetical protein CAEBREN_09208 [Caenorhabditis brenneri]
MVQSFSKIERNVIDYIIELAIQEDPLISFRGEQISFDYEFTHNMLENGTSHRVENDGYKIVETIVKQCKDKLEDWKNWLKYVKEVLNFRIQIVSYYFEPIGNRNKEIIDYLKSFEEPIESFEINCDNELLADEYTKYIFENIVITDFVSLDASNSNTFQTRVPDGIQTLFIRNAQWLTLAQLLTFDIAEIHLMHSSLTPLDLNHLLRSWTQSESNLMLKNFEVYIDNLQSMEIIMNLPHEIADPNEVSILEIGWQNVQFQGGLDIKRNDGKRAKIFLRWRDPNLIFAFYVL